MAGTGYISIHCPSLGMAQRRDGSSNQCISDYIALPPDLSSSLVREYGLESFVHILCWTIISLIRQKVTFVPIAIFT